MITPGGDTLAIGLGCCNRPLVSPESDLGVSRYQGSGKGVRAKHAHPCPKFCALITILVCIFFTNTSLAYFHTEPEEVIWMTSSSVWPTHLKFEVTYSDDTTEDFVAVRQADTFVWSVYNDPESDGSGTYYRFCKDADVDDRWVMAAATAAQAAGNYWFDIFEYEDVLPWEGSYREALSNSYSLSEVRILNNWVEWGRLDVVWIPLLYGFIMGFLLDVLLHFFGFIVAGLLNPWLKVIESS